MPAAPPLPATLAEIAGELYVAASQQAYNVEAFEVLAARGQIAAFDRALVEAGRAAQVLGDAHRLVKALIPHEAQVRALAGGGR